MQGKQNNKKTEPFQVQLNFTINKEFNFQDFLKRLQESGLAIL